MALSGSNQYKSIIFVFSNQFRKEFEVLETVTAVPLS